jgi:hypothetical protein
MGNEEEGVHVTYTPYIQPPFINPQCELPSTALRTAMTLQRLNMGPSLLLVWLSQACRQWEVSETCTVLLLVPCLFESPLLLPLRNPSSNILRTLLTSHRLRIRALLLPC